MRLIGDAEASIFVSDSTKRLYSPFLPSASHVIPNGIDLELLDEEARSIQREQAQRLIGFNPHEIVVLQVGTVCHRKGQIFTMHAANKIWQDRPDIDLRFVFVGSRRGNPDEQYVSDTILAMAAKAGKPDKVVLVEETDQVVQYLKAADIFVFPSLNESFPLATLEAMAFRLPVIASPVFGLLDQIDDGVNGFLTPPNDTEKFADRIIALAQDSSLRRRMGESGRRLVENQYQLPRMIESYDKILKRHLSTLEHPKPL